MNQIRVPIVEDLENPGVLKLNNRYNAEDRIMDEVFKSGTTNSVEPKIGTVFILHRSNYRDDPDDLMYMSKYRLVKHFLKSDLYMHDDMSYTVSHWGDSRIDRYKTQGNQQAGRYLIESLEEWLDYWSKEEQANPNRDRHWDEDRKEKDLTSAQWTRLRRFNQQHTVELHNRCYVWVTVETTANTKSPIS